MAYIDILSVYIKNEISAGTYIQNHNADRYNSNSISDCMPGLFLYSIILSFFFLYKMGKQEIAFSPFSFMLSAGLSGRINIYTYPLLPYPFRSVKTYIPGLSPHKKCR